MKSTDAQSLIALADWFDDMQDKGNWQHDDRDIQKELRRIADRLDGLITKPLVIATLKATPTKHDQMFTVEFCPNTLDQFIDGPDDHYMPELIGRIGWLKSEIELFAKRKSLRKLP